MISSVSIARSALDRSAQGAGLGQALVKDAIGRRQQAEAITGSRALHVQAKDERAAAFYARFGFQPSLSAEQGAGLGQALLKDAIKRHLQAEAIIGSRALLVHAKDERAAAFYARFGFQPSFSDPLHLFLLTKDMKRIPEPR